MHILSTIAGARPDQSQEPGAPSGPPMWVICSSRRVSREQRGPELALLAGEAGLAGVVLPAAADLRVESYGWISL